MRRLPSRVLPSLLLLAALPACLRNVPPADAGNSEAFARIRDWEDRRSLGEGQLVSWAQGQRGAEVRVRALRALARIQDHTALDVILAGLEAAEAPVRDVGNPAEAARTALGARPRTETNPDARPGSSGRRPSGKGP